MGYSTAMPLPGPALALDVGTRTIGLAISDAGRGHRFPVRTLTRRSVAKDAAELARITAERGVTALVVGLPRGLDGAEGRSARLARQVGEALAALTGLPLHYQDEQYTTLEAEERLRAAGLDARHQRPVIDQAAAMVILEDWLAARPPEGERA